MRTAAPNGTDLFHASTHDLEVPDFIFIGNRSGIRRNHPYPYFVARSPHQPDGIAGVGAAFHGNGLQLLDQEQAIVVLHGSAFRAKGSFTHGQLLFI